MLVATLLACGLDVGISVASHKLNNAMSYSLSIQVEKFPMSLNGGSSVVLYSCKREQPKASSNQVKDDYMIQLLYSMSGI